MMAEFPKEVKVMRIKKILIIALTLILLFSICLNGIAAKKNYKTFGNQSKKSIARIWKKIPKAIDDDSGDGVVVIQRYKGSW